MKDEERFTLFESEPDEFICWWLNNESLIEGTPKRLINFNKKRGVKFNEKMRQQKRWIKMN